MPSGRRKHRLRRLIAAVLLLAAAIAYACIPRKADLTRFDPARMGTLEASMWRDYYEKRYVALFTDLYRVARDENGFSSLDSVRIAVTAARAARTFQPSTSRAQAEAALPLLVDYFRILARAAPVPVDVEAAARTELAWWQARREAVGPGDYGLMIARVTTLLYGIDGDEVRHAGVLRAQAMAFRDARGNDITDADWAALGAQLRSSYTLLKQALPRPGK